MNGLVSVSSSALRGGLSLRPRVPNHAQRRTLTASCCSAAACLDASDVQIDTSPQSRVGSVRSAAPAEEPRPLLQKIDRGGNKGGGGGDEGHGRGGDGFGDDANNGFLALAAIVSGTAGLRHAVNDAVLCSGTFVLADLVAQLATKGFGGDLDIDRLFRLAAFGLLIKGPAMSWFYKALDRSLPGNSAQRVAEKMVVDQTCWSWMNNAAFLFMLPLMEGRPIQEAAACVTENFPTVQKTAYILWPAAHIVNFAIVPSACRTLYVSAVSFTWTAICCLLFSPDPLSTERAS